MQFETKRKRIQKKGNTEIRNHINAKNRFYYIRVFKVKQAS